jgi:plastocyanin
MTFLVGALMAACAASPPSLGTPTPSMSATPVGPSAPPRQASLTAVASPPGVTGTVPRTPSPAAASADGVTIEMGEHFFSPAQIVVPVGTTVVWRVTGTQTHDVLAEDGSFYSRTMGPGQTFSYTFLQPGIYRYICTPHVGDGMAGEIVVQ